MSVTDASFSWGWRSLTRGLVAIVACFLLQAPESFAGEPAAFPIASPEPAIAGWGMWQPMTVAPHLVLRPHRQPSWNESNGENHSHRSATAHHPQHHHGGHHRLAHVAGARAAVPEAETIYRKKVPYSYGYFGAQEHRHWSLHRGHQQDRIEWVLR